jgi:hypothetical protein
LKEDYILGIWNLIRRIPDQAATFVKYIEEGIEIVDSG